MFSILLFIVQAPVAPEKPSLQEVRTLFLQSGKNAKVCRHLNSMLAPFNELNRPALGAYRACATMMMAQHIFNPASKFSFFNSGRDLLEKCIAADRNNAELRYLRFVMQSEAPFFLGYRAQMADDKLFIISNFRSLEDPQLREMISSFLIKSKFLSDDEKKHISNK